ncbi:MAG: OmpA family protein [Treponema sp.]|nr:OmpA family protein [Treponema sp.]
MKKTLKGGRMTSGLQRAGRGAVAAAVLCFAGISAALPAQERADWRSQLRFEMSGNFGVLKPMPDGVLIMAPGGTLGLVFYFNRVVGWGIYGSAGFPFSTNSEAPLTADALLGPSFIIRSNRVGISFCPGFYVSAALQNINAPDLTSIIGNIGAGLNTAAELHFSAHFYGFSQLLAAYTFYEGGGELHIRPSLGIGFKGSFGHIDLPTQTPPPPPPPPPNKFRIEMGPVSFAGRATSLGGEPEGDVIKNNFVLDEVAKLFKTTFKNFKIEVQGFANPEEGMSESEMQELGLERAQFVIDYLVNIFEADRSRMTAVGIGGSPVLFEAGQPDAWYNGRVEFVVEEEVANEVAN